MTAGITHKKTFKTKGDIKTEFNEIVQTNLKLTKERRELKDDLKEVQKECELLRSKWAASRSRVAMLYAERDELCREWNKEEEDERICKKWQKNG